MKSRVLTLTPLQTSSFINNYNSMIIAKTYKFIGELKDNETVISVLESNLIIEDQPRPIALCFIQGNAMIIKGKNGPLAIFKDGIRRKFTLVAEDAFWSNIADDISDEDLAKFLTKKGYIDKVKSTQTSSEYDSPLNSNDW